ncbi:putative reverse transcriptase domain-containing protein [Tanacetum coccineum]
MDDLGASINVMPRSIFEHLLLTNLKKTNMLCEMADMSKKTPLGIVENVLVKINIFLFLSDFIIIDNIPSETIILGRPFLATIHAENNIFAGKFSLGINEDKISFDAIRKDQDSTNPSERIFMVNSCLISRPQSPAQNDSAIVNNPTHRSFDDYKWGFNLEIDKLVDEYELGIGKKGHILDNIWEYTMAGADIDTFTMEQYLALSRENQALGVPQEDGWTDSPQELSIHRISLKRPLSKGPHLDKDCPLNEEVKQAEEVKYGEFRRTTPFNGNNGGKFCIRPHGYYTKTDNRPPYGERRQSLEELLAKHQEESA